MTRFALAALMVLSGLCLHAAPPPQAAVDAGAAAKAAASTALSPAAGSDAAVVLSFYGALNQGDTAALSALLAPGFRSDASLPGLKPGAQGLEAWAAGLRQAFPDGQVVVLDCLSQGSQVAVRYRFTGTQRGRFLSLRPTRRYAKVLGMDLWTVKDGKLTAQSGGFDALGLLVQLGIAPELH